MGQTSLTRAIEVARLADSTSVDEAAATLGRTRETVKRLRRLAKESGMYVTGGTVLSPTRGKHAPRILMFDIETRPSLAYIWRCYDECISPAQMLEHTDILCWAAKWLDSDEMICDSREKDPDDRRICETLWQLMDEADIVVAHNGQGFDVKSMNTRWVQYGFVPPSPYKVVDTLKIAKGCFKFNINKLDYVARFLGVGRKQEHEGFELWTKCMNGDPDAWERMREYNRNDVLILEGVYLKLRAWDKKHPNVATMYSDESRRCIVCGSEMVKEIPQASFTAVSVYPSYRCDNCGKVMRDWKADKREKPLRNSL